MVVRLNNKHLVSESIEQTWWLGLCGGWQLGPPSATEIWIGDITTASSSTDFHKDFVSLESATKIQLKGLAEEMQAIITGMYKVKQELDASANDGPISKGFHERLKEFTAYAEEEVKAATNLYADAGRNADGLVLYFGEDLARCPFEQASQILLNFVRSFRKCDEENRREAEAARKKAEKEIEMTWFTDPWTVPENLYDIWPDE